MDAVARACAEALAGEAAADGRGEGPAGAGAGEGEESEEVEAEEDDEGAEEEEEEGVEEDGEEGVQEDDEGEDGEDEEGAAANGAQGAGAPGAAGAAAAEAAAAARRRVHALADVAGAMVAHFQGGGAAQQPAAWLLGHLTGLLGAATALELDVAAREVRGSRLVRLAGRRRALRLASAGALLAALWEEHGARWAAAGAEYPIKRGQLRAFLEACPTLRCESAHHASEICVSYRAPRERRLAECGAAAAALRAAAGAEPPVPPGDAWMPGCGGAAGGAVAGDDDDAAAPGGGEAAAWWCRAATAAALDAAVARHAAERAAAGLPPRPPALRALAQLHVSEAFLRAAVLARPGPRYWPPPAAQLRSWLAGPAGGGVWQLFVGEDGREDLVLFAAALLRRGQAVIERAAAEADEAEARAARGAARRGGALAAAAQAATAAAGGGPDGGEAAEGAAPGAKAPPAATAVAAADGGGPGGGGATAAPAQARHPSPLPAAPAALSPEERRALYVLEAFCVDPRLLHSARYSMATRFTSHGGVSLVDVAAALAVWASPFNARQLCAGHLFASLAAAWVLQGDGNGGAPVGAPLFDKVSLDGPTASMVFSHAGGPTLN